MSETRRQDPLRRTPPTIDLKAEVVPKGGGSSAKPQDSKDSAKGQDPAKEGATAIEPVASTGLGSEPFPKAATKPGSGESSSPASASTAQKGPGAAQPPKPPGEPPKGAEKPVGTGSSAQSSTVPAAAKPGAVEPKPIPGSGGSAKPGEPTKTADTTSKPAATPGSAGTTPSSATPGQPAKAAETAKPGSTVPPTGPAGKAAEPAKSGEQPKDAVSAKSEPAKGPDGPKGPDSAKPTSSTTATPRTEPSSEKRGNAGAIFAAGVVGGLLGAGLAIGIPHLMPPDTAVQDRIATLERRVAALPTGQGPLEPRIAALEAGLKQAAEEARTAARQAAEAAGRPASGPAGGPDQEARSGLQALSARVQDGATKTAANTTALAALTQKLDGFGKDTADRLTAVSKDVETVVVHLKSLQADTAALRTGTASLDTRTTAAEKQLTTLNEGLGRVSSDLARLSPAALQAGLRVVVSGRLDEALRSGSPLGPALSALAKLGTDAPTLAPLRPFAETPAPSPAALLAEFRPLATAMTTVPAQPDETWWEKGRRVLGKVVTVQAVSDGDGQDVPSLIARIQSSLGRGAVSDAKAAWDKLPAEKRKLSAAWGEKLAARVAAEDAARRIGAQSLAALDAATR